MLGPIFAREVVTVPRRDGHYLTRATAVGLLWVLGVTTWQASVGFENDPTLGQTARFGLLLFQIITFVELTLLLFFAALSAAGTVSQEKDRRTFILLLLTDMRDYEIVLGKLLGALLPIGLLLLITMPVLSMLLLLGGISVWQVLQAGLVLGATALAAGSLGGLVALWRERTFQALALSVLLLVLYICVVQGVGLLDGLIPGVDWALVQSWLDPFVALQTVLEPPLIRGPLPPACGFALTMLFGSVLINGFGIWKLRSWNPSGEPIMQREKIADVGLGERVDAEEDEGERGTDIHAAPGAAREVWANPILWREIRTQAYGKRPLLVKLAYFIALALIGYFAISSLHAPGGRPDFAAAYGLVPVAVLSLLLISAQAVTSITSERDGKSLDLLLATDMSPSEFIFGKLGGVLYNTKEYLVPPFLLAVYYAVAGALGVGSMMAAAGALLVLFAFVLALGLHVALRNANSRTAIANTLGTVFFVSVGTLIVIYLIVINGGSFANQWLSFVAFIFLGIGGLWWVLSADRPSPALTLASWLCPLAMFYCVTNIIVADPRSQESADPLIPFLVVSIAFGFSVFAMLVPMLSEFDVALGRTTVRDE